MLSQQSLLLPLTVGDEMRQEELSRLKGDLESQALAQIRQKDALIAELRAAIAQLQRVRRPR